MMVRASGQSHRGDSGFSLVEVVIAMLVLALMAMAFLPVLLGAMRTNGVNRNIVSATSVANALIADARREGTSGCAAVGTWAARSDLAPATSGFTVNATRASCPSSLPAAVKLTVVVRPADDPASTLIELTTKIMVESP